MRPFNRPQIVLLVLLAAWVRPAPAGDCLVWVEGQIAAAGRNPVAQVTHVRRGPDSTIPGNLFVVREMYADLGGDRIAVMAYPNPLARRPSAPEPAPATGSQLTREIATAYTQAIYGDRLDDSTLKFAVDAILADKSAGGGGEVAMKWWNATQGGAARALPGHGIATTEGIRLSNTGNDRHFWFRLSGTGDWVPARILDLHPRQEGMNVLVEYIDLASPGSQRRRHVAELSFDEFNTIRREPPEGGPASGHFVDSLSPLEHSTRALADRLRMKLFGFSSLDRFSTPKRQATARSAFQELNSTDWNAILHRVRARWPSELEEIRLPHEKDPGYNVVDVFSKMDPRTVLERFHAQDFEYLWSITEDGTLKIVPFGQVGVNHRPTPLRISGGRRIYAGGYLRINPDGSLNVHADSFLYQNQDLARGGASAFTHENPNLDEFVGAVFATQAERRVRGFGAQDAPGYWKSAEDRDRHAGKGANGARDFARHHKVHLGNKDVAWNSESGQKPLDLKDWHLKAFGTPLLPHDESHARIGWAHYVLGTNPGMKVEEIKARYRKLMQQFHPDKQQDALKKNEASELSKQVNNAYHHLKEGIDF